MIKRVLFYVEYMWEPVSGFSFENWSQSSCLSKNLSQGSCLGMANISPGSTLRRGELVFLSKNLSQDSCLGMENLSPGFTLCRENLSPGSPLRWESKSKNLSQGSCFEYGESFSGFFFE